jgi:F-type H+-transporting ATPase subunit delta
LSAENEKQIIAELKAVTGGSIELHKKVDPNLIGGFVLTIAGRQIDTSLSNALVRLKRDFAQRIITTN